MAYSNKYNPFSSPAPFLLFIIAVVVFLPTLGGGFVYDDNPQVLANPWIKSFAHIPEIFSSSNWGFSGGESNIYRPLFHIVLLVEYHIFGAKPFGYHLFNIIMHALNTLLVYTVAFEFFRRAPGGGDHDKVIFFGSRGVAWSFLAGLVFAIHPINVEVAAWISALPELTFTFFSLLSVYMFMTLPGRDDIGEPIKCTSFKYFASLFFFAMALLCKETAMAVLVFVFIIDKFFFAASWRRNYKVYIPFIVIALIYMSARTYAIGGLLHHKQIEMSTFMVVINIFPLLAAYFSKLLFPVNLNALYTFHPISSITEAKGLISIAATLGYLILLALAYIKKRPALLLLLLWIVVPLLPVLYAPALATAAFADRYLYISSAAFAIIVSISLRWFVGARERGGAAASVSIPAAGKVRVYLCSIFVAVVLVLFLVGTIKREAVWKSELTLWSDTVKRSPGSSNAQFNLALVYHDMKNNLKAIKHYREAIRLSPPDSADAYYNIALIYLSVSNIEGAREELTSALKVNPDYIRAKELLSRINRRGGR